MPDTSTQNRAATEPTDDKPTEPKRLFDLSATQLVGGALAAMTSAVIGARLGVAGTILGAAIGSLVAGVAGSLYTASLKHTKDKLTSALVGRVGDTPVSIAPAFDRSDATLALAEETAVRQDWSWDAPTSIGPTAAVPAAAVAPASSAPVAVAADVDVTRAAGPRIPWRPILISTAAVFLIAIAGITGFELVSGHAVSGGQGTTITQVSEGRSGNTDGRPATLPSSTPSAETSSEPSTEPVPSSEPSSSASSEPSDQPSESPQPSEPSDPSASSEPSASTTPSTPTDDGSAAAGSDGGVVDGG